LKSIISALIGVTQSQQFLTHFTIIAMNLSKEFFLSQRSVLSQAKLRILRILAPLRTTLGMTVKLIKITIRKR
jgi:hypothetical protein